MANIEKHVKGLPEMLMDPDAILVPTRARSAHLVSRYIKGRRRSATRTRPPVDRAASKYVIQLDGVPATSAAADRVRRRVDAINSWLEQTETPFRLRVIPASRT